MTYRLTYWCVRTGCYIETFGRLHAIDILDSGEKGQVTIIAEMEIYDDSGYIS